MNSEIMLLFDELNERIDSQEQQINLLEEKLARIQEQLPDKEAIEITENDTIEIIEKDPLNYVLNRYEAGLTAFVAIKEHISMVTLTMDEKLPPEFLYFGLTKNINDIQQNTSYLVNSAGKARIPGEPWADLEMPYKSIVSGGRQFCFEIAKYNFLTVDDGIREFLFEIKDIDQWYCIIGLFGEGKVDLEVEV